MRLVSLNYGTEQEEAASGGTVSRSAGATRLLSRVAPLIAVGCLATLPGICMDGNRAGIQ